MRLHLSTWQRAGLIVALGQVRGNVATLRLALEALEAVEWSREEQEEIEYQQENGRAKWNEAGAGRVWEVEVGGKVARFMRGVVEGYGQWPVGKVVEVFDLEEQLGENADFRTGTD